MFSTPCYSQYLCRGAANLRASPPAAGPSGHQLTGDWQDRQDWQDLQDWQDWQSAVKGDFGHPNL